MTLKRRSSDREFRGEPGWEGGAEEFREHFPAIWDFLTLQRWPDSDQPRQTGSLLIFAQDGMIKFCLKDNDVGEYAFWAFPGLWQGLQRVNADLVDGRGDWRKDRGTKQPRRNSS